MTWKAWKRDISKFQSICFTWHLTDSEVMKRPGLSTLTETQEDKLEILSNAIILR